MWSGVWFVLLIAVVSSALTLDISDSLRTDWAKFKTKYGRQFASPVEEAQRFEIFAKNKLEIDQFNQRGAGFHLGVNHFSDWTQEELQRFHGANKRSIFANSHSGEHSPAPEELLLMINDDNEPIPDSVDWRTQNRVTSVKDQGFCASGWAFATAALLEGQQPHGKTGQPIDLSVQQQIDCGYMDCSGGELPQNVRFFVEHEGLMGESDYPYLGRNGQVCRYDQAKSVIRPKSFTLLPRNNETTLMRAVANYGPVGVSVDSFRAKFRHYRGGIFSDNGCNGGISHSVVVVGYHLDLIHGSYWILKNSWGEDWGEKGYMRLAMGKNMCLVAFEPVIASV